MIVVDQSSSAASSRRTPFTVRLSPQLVNGLVNRQLPFSVSPSEISGLLYGLAEQGSIVVQAFRPFQAGKTVSGFRDRTEQNQFLQQHLTAFSKDAELATLQLLGWYTLRQDGGLTGGDLTYHNWFFPRPDDLALVIRPDGASDLMLELFCRATTGVLSEEARRVGLARLSGTPVEQPVEVVLGASIQDDFFMRAYEEESEDAEEAGNNWKESLMERSRRALTLLRPSKADRPTLPPTPAAAAKLAELPSGKVSGPLLKPSTVTPVAISVPAPQTVPASPSLMHAWPSTQVPRARPPWIAATLVFLAASALSFGCIYYLRTLQRSDSWPRLLRSAPPASALGLRLEAQGDRLLLSWNRQDALVRHARNGFLEIVDGTLRRQVVLDPSQVANGSILYHPTSDDISFQLEVRGADGRHEAESMRVLEAAKPAALDLSQPEKRTSREPAIDIPRTEPEHQGARPSVAPRKERTLLEKKAAVVPPEVPAAIPAETIPKPPIASASAKPAAEEELHAVPEDVPEPRDATIPVQNSKLEPAIQARPPLIAPVPKVSDNLSSYQPPRPIRQVLPNVSTLAPGTLATAGQVEVIVKINAAGRVTGAQIMPHGRTLSAALIGSALTAAKQWQFAPAVLNAKPVESEHSILFQFSQR